MDSIGVLKQMKKDARFSPDRTYRYALWRIWNETLPKVMFIGLNPSAANENKDDPTIKRCIEFSKSWGYGGLVVGNLFAYVSQNPNEMMRFSEPVGLENNQWLLKLAEEAELVVAAWGDDGAFRNRGSEVRRLIPDLHCLKLNKSGEPSHPLYLLSDLKPKPLTTANYDNANSVDEAGCILCQNCFEENNELICERQNKPVDASDICDFYRAR